MDVERARRARAVSTRSVTASDVGLVECGLPNDPAAQQLGMGARRATRRRGHRPCSRGRRRRADRAGRSPRAGPRRAGPRRTPASAGGTPRTRRRTHAGRGRGGPGPGGWWSSVPPRVARIVTPLGSVGEPGRRRMPPRVLRSDDGSDPRRSDPHAHVRPRPPLPGGVGGRHAGGAGRAGAGPRSAGAVVAERARPVRARRARLVPGGGRARRGARPVRPLRRLPAPARVRPDDRAARDLPGPLAARRGVSTASRSRRQVRS